ncbi:MAG: M48 family metallopeptidase [Deltaproteobacteria bacterium]|nr:M48 family metallopeptidase [Deltaproteobacteria bacterium]
MSATFHKNAACVFVFLLMLLSCAKVPYTEREQLMMVSDLQETKLGETAFEQIKEKSKISSDPAKNAILRRVGERIAAAVDKPQYQWEFALIDEDTVNAFALPGGKVAFYDGILPICQDENGIATVMGHEVAHVLARHGAERLSQEQIVSVGQMALLAALLGRSPEAQDAMMRAYGLGAQVGVLLPYSRKHELEADEIGLILMAKAGYDPHAAVAFWKRMNEAKKGGGPPEFLSTHPSDEKRIERIESLVPKAMEYYRK